MSESFHEFIRQIRSGYSVTAAVLKAKGGEERQREILLFAGDKGSRE
jgi:hypothetical protein